jgi:transposase InsO family protein
MRKSKFSETQIAGILKDFTAQVFVDWCEHGMTLHFIQPGKPDQNAYIERLNRSYRTEVDVMETHPARSTRCFTEDSKSKASSLPWSARTCAVQKRRLQDA